MTLPACSAVLDIQDHFLCFLAHLGPPGPWADGALLQMVLPFGWSANQTALVLPCHRMDNLQATRVEVITNYLLHFFKLLVVVDAGLFVV